jgi:hypothetical protein
MLPPPGFQTPKTEPQQAGEKSCLGFVVKGVLIVAGIYGVAAIFGNAAETAGHVRHTIKG